MEDEYHVLFKNVLLMKVFKETWLKDRIEMRNVYITVIVKFRTNS